MNQNKKIDQKQKNKIDKKSRNFFYQNKEINELK